MYVLPLGVRALQKYFCFLCCSYITKVLYLRGRATSILVYICCIFILYFLRSVAVRLPPPLLLTFVGSSPTISLSRRPLLSALLKCGTAEYAIFALHLPTSSLPHSAPKISSFHVEYPPRPVATLASCRISSSDIPERVVALAHCALSGLYVLTFPTEVPEVEG